MLKKNTQAVLLVILSISLWVAGWSFIATYVELAGLVSGLNQLTFPNIIIILLFGSHIFPIIIAGWIGYLKSNESWSTAIKLSLLVFGALVIELLLLANWIGITPNRFIIVFR